jgi:hypothetical protein
MTNRFMRKKGRKQKTADKRRSTTSQNGKKVELCACQKWLHNQEITTIVIARYEAILYL